MIAYFFFGAHKIKRGSIQVEKPEPFTAKQKISIWVIFAVILLLVVPQFVELIVPNPVTAWMKANLSMPVSYTHLDFI